MVVGIVAGLVDSTFLWDMVSMGTLTAFIVVSIAVPVLRSQERAAGTYTKGGFRVPFGGYFVPGLSILACAYLMINLSHATKMIFTIWMVVAVLTYFIYGIRNSRLNKV